MKSFLTILLTAALAAAGTWFAMTRKAPAGSASAPAAERRPLYYQSAMHPWIKSDKPGRCTICGMELTPVYPGDKGFDDTGGGNIVALTQTQIQVLHVQTAGAGIRPLVRTLRVAGNIDENATRRRVLAAFIDGRIEKLHINFVGAEVAAGQPLADYFSPALLQAEREYRQLTGPLRRASALRLRQMGLTAPQIEALDGKPEDALTSQILAPMSGTVVSQVVVEGQYVATGQPLFEIADFSTMWFQFHAYEQDLPWLRPGLTVKVTTPAVPGRTFDGTITFIDPNFDPATRSTRARVELANPVVEGRRELSHRLYAEGSVELEAPAVLAVPRSAVIHTGPEAVVYVDQGGGAYERRVLTLGRRGDTHLEVLAGVTAGEAVVTNGNLLIDGQSEMNRAFMSPPEPGKPAGADLNDAQRAATGAFLTVADAMAAALAADDLDTFHKASAPAMKVTGEMLDALGGVVADPEPLDRSRHFHGFPDIMAARVAFHKFSVAAVAALEPLRKSAQTAPFEVYECGMVDEAIPGVPKQARWIQTGGRPLANPFFGAKMLRCGKTIQP